MPKFAAPAALANNATLEIIPAQSNMDFAETFRMSIWATGTFRLEQQVTLDGGSTWVSVRQQASTTQTGAGTYTNATTQEYYGATEDEATALVKTRWAAVNTSGGSINIGYTWRMVRVRN
jgi:hypothetical protein